MANRYLFIYLNDHLAGSAGGLELARRSARESSGTLQTFLQELRVTLEDDQEALRKVLIALGGTENRPKQIVGYLAASMGKLKFNGHLTTRSPLSQLVELEGLLVGSRARQAMWRALDSLQLPSEAGHSDFATRMERAEQNIERLEKYRLETANKVFAEHLPEASPSVRLQT